MLIPIHQVLALCSQTTHTHTHTRTIPHHTIHTPHHTHQPHHTMLPLNAHQIPLFPWDFLSSGFFSHPASACHRTPCPSRFSSDPIFPTGPPGFSTWGQWLVCLRSQSWSNAVLPWFQDRLPVSEACFLFPHHQEVLFLSLRLMICIFSSSSSVWLERYQFYWYS